MKTCRYTEAQIIRIFRQAEGTVPVTRSLDRIIEWRRKPGTIKVDNGPEYISQTLRKWAEKHKFTLKHFQPGQPQQNAYVECYNRTVRHEWLDHTSSKALKRLKPKLQNGYGHTTMTAPTSLSWFAGKPLPGNEASAA